jgi:hypothetical protein
MLTNFDKIEVWEMPGGMAGWHTTASGSTFLEFPAGFLLAFNKLYRCPSGKAL